MMSTASILIQIQDENDNPPVFHGHDNGVYILKLSESTRNGDKVSGILYYPFLKFFFFFNFQVQICGLYSRK